MKIDLLFLPSEIKEKELEGKLAIVIDVLRASSSIATALYHGAKDVIPVESSENATRLMQGIGKKYVLLCGEREGNKIEGFDLGNSPFEYTEEVVKDKTLIFCSTNGSRAMVKAAFAQKVIIGAFINLESILKFCLTQKPADVSLICSGREERFSLEDTVCAGMMVAQLKQRLENGLEMTDAAQAGWQLYQQHQKNIPKMVSGSRHGQYLFSLGFEEDLAYCSQLDILPVIPVLENGRIANHTG